MSKEAMKINDAGSGYSDGAESQDVPPGYKRTEVGVIPEDWETKQLGELFEITSSKRVFQKDWKSEGVPFYRARELAVLDENNALENELFITENMYNDYKMKYGVPQAGDILVTGVGTLGKTYVVRSDDKFYFKDGNIIWFKANGAICSEFLKQLYLTPLLTKQIDEGSAGTTVGTYTISGAKKTKIPLPPPIEQHAVAKALSDVDGLLGTLDALIAKKRSIKQAAMQQLLTGKTRLPGFSGEWRSVILGEHVTFINTGANSRAELKPEGAVKYLHYGDIHTSNQVYLDPQVKMMPCLSEGRARKLARLRNGDLVLVDASEDLVGVGKSFEIKNIKGVDVVAGLHTIVARFDKSVLVDGFKAYLQYCPAFRDQLKRLAAGTKVFATNRTHISNVEIQLPGIKEQTAIAIVLSDMDAEITALEQRRDKTKQIKQGMMQQLLTGRIRLVKPKEAA